MIKDLFAGKKDLFGGAAAGAGANGAGGEIPPGASADIPDDMWAKCNGCGRALYQKRLDDTLRVCPLCGYHFRLTPEQRIEYTFDEGSFSPFDFSEVRTSDPLGFEGYTQKIADLQEQTGHDEAVCCGTAAINGLSVALCVMNSFFMMGSMGYVVGECITRTAEYAAENRLPLVIFTCSGGARMQEGIVSLMQMAKISGALKRLSDAGLLYVTVITNPTTGGVTASFASLGDIIIAEKGALIGFAGKRVIEQTIKQKLPKNFQTAEFARDHGLVDIIAERKELAGVLGRIIKLHTKEAAL